MQPHGVRLPKDDREKLAERAYELSLREPKLSREEIGFRLDVSTPTARNLVNFGRRLKMQQN